LSRLKIKLKNENEGENYITKNFPGMKNVKIFKDGESFGEIALESNKSKSR
jgi:hypothetical protein